MAHCDCGSKTPFKRCCGAVISGKRAATTPEDLVRARYAAFVRVDVDFLMQSHHSETACRFDVEANRKWAADSTWEKLELLDVQEDGDVARVEFVVTYVDNGLRKRHREKSELRKQNGAWLYYDGAPV